VFVGTGGAGIWQGQLTNRGLFASTQQNICPIKQLNGEAVLCLVLESTSHTLYAGTTDGVFRGQSPFAASNWAPLAGLPQKAVVTRLAATTTYLLAGTARHGLRRLDLTARAPQQWLPVL
jgi:hypothetical protein